MKTALDLPDDLVREIKIRAVHEGRKLKDMVADLLRRGLESNADTELPEARLGIDDLTGLPVLFCSHPAPNGRDLTPDQIAEILMDQEVQWLSEAGR